MKKVGILTLHFSNNYGAVLQTFALYKTISRIDECEVTVIPFCKKSFSFDKNTPSKVGRSLMDEKRSNLRKFLLDECGTQIVDTEDITDYLGLEYYIVGSDQVWNTSFLIFDEKYFLGFVPENAKRVAYAASIGMSVKNNRFQEDIFKKYLPLFDDISIREIEHLKFVEECSGKNCELVLDPTFLLDRKEYEDLLPQREMTEKFILLFWIDHDDMLFQGIDFANKIALKYGYKIYHCFEDLPEKLIMNSAGSIYYGDIANFLWYIKNSELIITNSFHAVTFSILFERPFYAFSVKTMSSRINNLKYLFDIEDRCIDTFQPLEKVDFYMDYTLINRKLKVYREKSLKFLKKALDVE